MPFIIIPFAKLEYISNYLEFVVKTISFSIFVMLVFLPYMVLKWHGSEEDMGVSRQIFEVVNMYLNGGLIFAMLMRSYLNRNDRRLVDFSAFFSLFCAAYFARRGVLLSYVVTYLFMIIINLHFQTKRKKLFSLFKYSIAIMILASFVFVIGSTVFSVIYGRMGDDTRTLVEVELLEQMESSGVMMTGKGYAGTYYSEFVDSSGIDRDGIETGYLHLILKGGIVYLVLMTLSFTPAVMLGFFKSNNFCCKILSCFALIFIVFFNVANSNVTFSIRYFIFLVVIYILYNPRYRKMSDKEFLNCMAINRKQYECKN